MNRQLRGWLPLVIVPTAVFFTLPKGTFPWVCMWSLSFAIYGCCKWLTWSQAGKTVAPLWQHLVYLLAWPGLDARAFLSPSDLQRTDLPTIREWYVVWFRILLGIVLVWGVARLLPSEWKMARGWFGVIGFLQILHFGLFGLLSCYWRSMGLSAKPLMQQPIRSECLSEFWGRRWNTAFRDLTHQFLFLPLNRKFGSIAAMWISFLISGLIHELVISYPAGGGYGGPTTFFLLQACGLSVERSRIGKYFGCCRGVSGRILAALFLLGPLPLLAHSPFVLNVIVPFLQVIGAGEG